MSTGTRKKGRKIESKENKAKQNEAYRIELLEFHYKNRAKTHIHTHTLKRRTRRKRVRERMRVKQNPRVKSNLITCRKNIHHNPSFHTKLH